MRPLLYFVRHGETAWNAELRLQGQADTGMTARGRAQARRNGRRLAGLIDDPEAFDFVASPLWRTRETMELVRTAMHLPAEGYEIEPRLVEVHFGDWQGFMMEDIAAESRELVDQRRRDKWNFVPPGTAAESYALLSERVAEWLAETTGPTVCVTHGGCLRALFKLVQGLDGHAAANLPIPQDRILRLENGSLAWL